MARQSHTTRIEEDGLRYTSKVAGSPFKSAAAFQNKTMSCFKCGKHRPRDQLRFVKLIGKHQLICDPKCPN